MSKVRKTLNEVGKLLKNALAKELEGQGHRASSSGSIIDGFKHKATDSSVTITTDKEYANILETGIPVHLETTSAISSSLTLFLNNFVSCISTWEAISSCF